MKVRDLVEILKQLNPNAEVQIQWVSCGGHYNCGNSTAGVDCIEYENGITSKAFIYATETD